MSEKTTLTKDEIMDRLRSFNFPEVDLIVGITSGASVPAKLIAELLDLPLRYIHINFRHPDNTPRYTHPNFIDKEDIPMHHRRILLVDDVSVTGKTIKCALDELSEYTVYTFVLKGKADYVLFPEINTCVDWPWPGTNTS